MTTQPADKTYVQSIIDGLGRLPTPEEINRTIKMMMFNGLLETADEAIALKRDLLELFKECEGEG